MFGGNDALSNESDTRAQNESPVPQCVKQCIGEPPRSRSYQMPVVGRACLGKPCTLKLLAWPCALALRIGASDGPKKDWAHSSMTNERHHGGSISLSFLQQT